MTYPPQSPDPQQPDQPVPGGTPPRASRRTLWITLACVGGLVVLCCGGAAVVAAIGATIKPSAVSATRAAQPTRPRPSATATPRPVSSKTAPPTTKAAPTSAKPTRPDYAAAARILTASEQHYRDQLAEGQRAFNTAAFAPWYQRETKDLQMDDAFKQADAYFNADNEPASIETWRTDMTDATSAFFQWANAALNGETGAGGPGTTTDEMRQDESKFREGLAAADKDAAAVAAGK